MQLDGTYRITELTGAYHSDIVTDVEFARFSDQTVSLPPAIFGTASADALDGTAGEDVIQGLGGDDVLRGFDGNDFLVGGDGADRLEGGEGNNYLDGGAGDDVMVGGSGQDVYTVGSINDVIIEAPLPDSLDIVRSYLNWVLGDNLENLMLLGDAQYGSGNSLDNQISGSAGANWLYGHDGADRLSGGGGDDHLYGGAGRDTFYQFGTNFGHDRIYDFFAGVGLSEVIYLSTSMFANFADVMAHATDVGGDCVIAKGGQSITLVGVLKAQLYHDDFDFLQSAPLLEDASAKGFGPLVMPDLDPLVLPSDFAPKGPDADVAVVCPIDPAIADMALEAMGGRYAKPIHQASPADFDWTW